ncbi:MAG: hypothetical protein K2N48_12495 [Muribaculaceae bacterium]|nr:hypothetical protein [Muribaculaceae bacterium]
MIYTVDRLRSDVMARLGEIARPQGLLSDSGVPWPEDVVSVKAVSLLDEVGSELIRRAGIEALGGGVDASSGLDVVMRRMPCGLYGAEIRLPGDFLRLASAGMSGWRRDVFVPVFPGSTEWSRQWSAEPGIAGCPDSPRAYVGICGAEMLLRLMGSESVEDSLEHLHVWARPVPDGQGEFTFPESLYTDLIAGISRCLV